MKLNWRWNLIFGIGFGLAYWAFGFNFIGMTKMPNSEIEFLYIPFVIIFGFIIYLSLLGVFYLFRKKVLVDNWFLNALIIGALICTVQFILDLIVMPVFTFPVPVFFYFFGGSTVLIFYPLIIPCTIACGWTIFKLAPPQ